MISVAQELGEGVRPEDRNPMQHRPGFVPSRDSLMLREYQKLYMGKVVFIFIE